MKAIWEWSRSAAAGAIIVCVISCGIAGWWGVLYPQLVLTQDAYRIVSEDGTVYEEGAEEVDAEALYREMLNAEHGRVRFRSRLWDYVLQLCGSFCAE